MTTHWSLYARSRVALSQSAQTLAEGARGLVPSVQDCWTRPGDTVEQAAKLVALAQQMLEQAVLFEREREASWENIGDALGVSKQTAHERFVESEKRLAKNLPELDEVAVSGLDEWCLENIPCEDPVRELAEAGDCADRMTSVWLRPLNLNKVAQVNQGFLGGEKVPELEQRLYFENRIMGLSNKILGPRPS